VASLPTATAQFGITVAGGHNTADPRQLVHVVSGNVGSEAVPAFANAADLRVQRFQADPVGLGTWTSFNVIGISQRFNLGAATVLRGVAARILVIGGQALGGAVIDNVDEYTNATVPAAVMTTHTVILDERAKFGVASSLSTNQVYVVGGIDGTLTEQTTVFEYTVANNGAVAGPPGTPSGTWVLRGNIALSRAGLGLSTPPPVTNFLPVKSAGRDARQDAIAVWIANKVRAARAPVSAADPLAVTGRTLFGTTGLVVAGFSCATCHGGPKWTRSIVDYAAPPSPADNVGLGDENVIGAELRKTLTQPGTFPGVLINVGTFTLGGGRTNEIRFNGADISQAVAPLGANGFNIPSLLSVHETAPYYYSGLAQTLEQVLDGSQDGSGGVRHHFVTSAADRAALVAFLRSIEDPTPIFP
jgi:hypothetical protein